jgi:hypothetical protein
VGHTDAIFFDRLTMSKRKLEDGGEGGESKETKVESLDSDQPPSKKQKTKKFGDQILIRYEPANIDSKLWCSFETSYYTLKLHCEHPFFDDEKIPDPPEMIITSEMPYASIDAFLRFAVDHPTECSIEVFEHPERKNSTIWGAKREKKNGQDDKSYEVHKERAFQALLAYPVAAYFGHKAMMDLFMPIIVRTLWYSKVYDNRQIMDLNGGENVSCLLAILEIVKDMDHGLDHARLLRGLVRRSSAMAPFVMDDKYTERYGKVFFQLLKISDQFKPEAVKQKFVCSHGANKRLWTKVSYIQDVLRGVTDWNARRQELIKSHKC